VAVIDNVFEIIAELATLAYCPVNKLSLDWKNRLGLAVIPARPVLSQFATTLFASVTVTVVALTPPKDA
jgi:hypothetical protein